jgi:group II intron reverse transcriptase/maturase
MATTKLITRLEDFRKRNSDNPNYTNKDIYRMFYKSELYIIAYNNIKSNDGAETKGGDSTSLHGFSQTWIDDIINSMRDESYQPSPSRTTYIPKQDGSGKMRKLAFPNGIDKLIQECVRIVLDCIFEPTFSNLSHGYRPNRSIHSAVAQVEHWRGTTWFIEGDISSCFDEVDHRVLESILRERIADERFIRLINKLLKAGYFDTDLEFHQSKGGVNQGSICSPILANIYLDKFDRFMEDIINRDTQGDHRKQNPEYAKVHYQLKKAKAIGDIIAIKTLKKKLNNIASVDVMDPNFKRIKYVRYADDFLIGIIGNKAYAKQIKQEIADFLRIKLKLRLSDNKTKITHARHDEANFLGFRITKDKSYSQIKILIDIKEIIRRLHEKGFCDKHGYPIGVTKVFNKPIHEIIKHGNNVLRGILTNLQGCHNFWQAPRIQYIVQFAIAKTIARKYRISMKKVFKTYGARLTVNYLNPKSQPKTISLALFRSFARNKEFFKNWMIKLKEHVVISYDTRNPLKKHCYVCDSSQNRRMFHRRKKSLIKQPIPLIVTVMLKINRRQICLCDQCFSQVTNNELECNQISASFR